MLRLDDAFWDRLVAEDWRKRPIVYKNIQDLIDNPVLRPDEIVAGLSHVARDALSQANAIRAMENVRLYLGGRLAQPPEYLHFLPQTTSFDEYCEQVSAKVGGEEFGVVLNFFHLMYPPFWDRVRALSAPLVQRLGLPATPAGLESRSAAWRPWRSYAVQHLWATGDHAANRMPA